MAVFLNNFQTAGFFESELRISPPEGDACEALISWVAQGKKQQFYAQNPFPVEVRKTRYTQSQHAYQSFRLGSTKCRFLPGSKDQRGCKATRQR
jgi:hypothetical protein